MSSKKKRTRSGLDFVPLTLETWESFESLFGDKGACGGCWCMTPRLKSSEYEKSKGASNKRLMKNIVKKGPPPGILGFEKGVPIAWCSLGPRSDFSRLERSRILKPIDDQPVWSIVCLFIAKEHRRKGVSVRMIEAASKYAAEQGAILIEGYPVEPKTSPMPDVFAYTGTASAFERAGFREILRRSETRPIMRREL